MAMRMTTDVDDDNDDIDINDDGDHGRWLDDDDRR